MPSACICGRISVAKKNNKKNKKYEYQGTAHCG